MTRRRNPTGQTAPPTSPIDEAMLADEASIAGELAGILEATSGFEISQIKGVLFQKPANGQGAWSWCDDVYPPWNLSAIFSDMRERFGSGFYQLRIYAAGKIRKNVDFAIAKEKSTALGAPVVSTGGGQFSEMMAMVMSQNAEARREASAAADRQATMITAMVTALVPVLGAALTNRPAGGQASETVALITALQDRKGGGGGLKETLEAMAAFKTLMGPGEGSGGEAGGGVDLDDLAGSAVRLIGPGIRAVGDYMARQRGQAGSEAGGPSASGPAAPGAVDQLALGPPASRFPIIDLVRDDVTYMFNRGFDPAKAADLVYDIIEANNVSEGEVNALAAAFALSPNGLEDLAREGIDLRSRPSWAAEFFAELHAIHSAAPDDSGGGEGGAGDPTANGPPSEGGAS